MNPFQLAGAALRRNLVGGAAIVALIAVAGALAIVASAVERGFRSASTTAADRFDLIIGAAGNPIQLLLSTVYLQSGVLDLLPEAALQQLSADPGVATVTPVAVTDSYGPYVIVATSVAFADSPGLFEGRLPANPHEALVGIDCSLAVGARFTPTHGAPHENVIEQHAHTFEIVVVGRVLSTGTPWDRAIIVPIETAWAMHDLNTGTDKLGPPWPAVRVPAIVIRPRTVGDAYRLRAKYRANGTTAIFPAEVLLPLYRLLGDGRDLLNGMALVFQVLVLCAVVLTPETVRDLRAALRDRASRDIDRRALAAVLAAELRAGELVPDLLTLVQSPHPLIAAVAKAAALRLGAPTSRTGHLDEVAPFLFDEDVAALKAWVLASPGAEARTRALAADAELAARANVRAS